MPKGQLLQKQGLFWNVSPKCWTILILCIQCLCKHQQENGCKRLYTNELIRYYVNFEGRRGACALHDVGGVGGGGGAPSPSPPAGIYTRRPMQRASCNRLVVNREIICSQPDIDNSRRNLNRCPKLPKFWTGRSSYQRLTEFHSGPRLTLNVSFMADWYLQYNLLGGVPAAGGRHNLYDWKFPLTSVSISGRRLGGLPLPPGGGH